MTLVAALNIKSAIRFDSSRNNFVNQNSAPKVVPWLSLLQNFIYQSLDSGSARVQILLAACQAFAMVKIFDSGSDWKKG